MRLVDVELGLQDGAAPEQLGESVLVPRVDHVDLEEGLVAHRVAVKVRPLAEDDERDILRRLALLVLVREGQLHRPVQRRPKAPNVVVHCVGGRNQPVPDNNASRRRGLTRLGIQLALVVDIDVRERSMHVRRDPLPSVRRSPDPNRGHSAQLVLCERRAAVVVL